MLHKNNSIEINGCMNVKHLIGCLISVLYWFHADPAPRIMLKSSLPWFNVQCFVSTVKVVACALSVHPSFLLLQMVLVASCHSLQLQDFVSQEPTGGHICKGFCPGFKILESQHAHTLSRKGSYSKNAIDLLFSFART